MDCPECGSRMVFQPELFEDRGEYFCNHGHRSGRVFVNEKQPAGVAAQQTAKKEKHGQYNTNTEGEEPEEIQPVPQGPARPIWQAKRVRAIRTVGWKVDGRLRTWFHTGKEYKGRLKGERTPSRKSGWLVSRTDAKCSD